MRRRAEGTKQDAAPAVQKYSPSQPRVPAGNPDGGQWTSSEVSGSSGGLSASGNRASLGPRYASLDPDTQTDASNAPVGVQYAGGIEDDENRSGSGQFEGTPAQLARQAIAEAQYRAVLARVLRLDPTWRPTDSLVAPDGIEGDIAKLEAATEEAEEHLARLRGLGFARDPETGHVIPPTEPSTGNRRVDSTTPILMDVFSKVLNQIGPRPDLTPGQYGTQVHKECAKALRALNLPGIDTNDIERTFSVDDNNVYGAKDSIRPDVILRDDDGNIIAIYDFKTGRGLSEDRVIRFGYMTESGRTVPVIELSRSRGALSKRR
jgi:hypothetical protein